MKHKTLFRLLLKAVGVYLFCIALGSLVSYAMRLVLQPFFFPANSPSRLYEVVYLASPLVQMAVGAYLFFGGKWVADKAIPGNRPYCHECGYDLTGAVGTRCNECGTPFKAEDVAAPTEASRAP